MLPDTKLVESKCGCGGEPIYTYTATQILTNKRRYVSCCCKRKRQEDMERMKLLGWKITDINTDE